MNDREWAALSAGDREIQEFAKERQMAECSQKLHAEGKPSPRTCAKCGLGPCHDALKNEIDATRPPAQSVVVPLQSELETPQAGRPTARQLLAQFAAANEVHRKTHETLREAEATAEKADELYKKAEAAVKTIPELREGKAIVFGNKVFMLEKRMMSDEYSLKITPLAE